MFLHTGKAMLQFKKIMILIVIVTFIFSLFASTLYAAHSGSPSPGNYSIPERGELVCARGDTLGDRGSTAGSGGPVVPIAGVIGGIHVPVKDFEAEAQLRSISKNIRIIAQNSIAIERDTNLIEKDTQAVRYYLRQLCEKEYVHDHTIQHAWARILGEFVKQTRDFVMNAYERNPIFVTTPNTYYRMVDFAVLSALLKDIRFSNIGQAAKALILEELTKRTFEDVFPYDENGNFEQWAPDALPDSLASAVVLSEDYWVAYRNFQFRPTQNVSSLVSLAEAEYEARRQKIRDLEEQKLNWGRGFLSYESCDLVLYKVNGTQNDWDRRNCRILTPGSLIQDSVSLIFGSAIRQMEEADEFEEWVAGNTIALLNDILNLNGLQRARVISTDPVSPDKALDPLQGIIKGTRPLRPSGASASPKELLLFDLETSQPTRLLDQVK